MLTNNRSSQAQFDSPVELRFLPFCEVVRAHGVKGTLKVRLLLRPLPASCKPGTLFYAQGGTPQAVTYFQRQGDFALLQLAGIADCDTAQHLSGKTFWLALSDLPELPAGQYYYHDLLGCKVILESGELLGELVEILESKVQAVYVVRAPQSKQELLVPAVPEFVRQVDLEIRQIIVRLADGMVFG